MIRFLALFFLLTVSLTAKSQYVFEDLINSERFGNLQIGWTPSVAVCPSNNNIYLSDFQNNRIVILNQDGSIQKIIESGNGVLFSQPYSLFVDTNGNIYAGSYGEILVFDSEGNFVRRFGSTGSGDGQFYYAFGIALDSSGNIFVLDSYNDRISVFQNDGNFLNSIAIPTGLGEQTFAYSMAMDGAGNIYIADYLGSKIIQTNASGALVNFFYSPYPMGVSIGADLNLYVSNLGLSMANFSYAPSITKYNLAGEVLDTFEGLQTIDSHNRSIYRFYSYSNAVKDADEVYINDIGGRILKVNLDTEQITEILGISGDTHVTALGDIATDTTGNVFLVDGINDKVQVFNNAGDYIRKFDIHDDGAGTVNYNYQISVDQNNWTFVLSPGVKVMAYDAEGIFQTEWSIKDDAFWGYRIAVDKDFVYVLSFHHEGEVKVYSKEGNFQQTIVLTGGTSGFINRLEIDSDGAFVIARSCQMEYYLPNGTYSHGFNIPNCQDINTFHVDANKIYVVSQCAIKVLSSEGGLLEEFGSCGFEPGDLSYPVAVTSAGDRIFVSDGNNNRVNIYSKNNLPLPSISFEDMVFSYTDLYHVLKATSSVQEPITYKIVLGDAVSFVSDSVIAINGTGEVVIEASQEATDTHRKATAVAKIKINKSELIFKADDHVRFYGNENPVLTFQIDGFRAEEDSTVINSMPTISTEATQFSSVGVYPIVFQGGFDNNYTFTFESGNLAVEKTTLYVFVGDTVREYGDENPPLPMSFYGFKNNETMEVLDEFAIEADATPTWPVGSYFVHMTKGQDDNYEIIFHEGAMLHITKAPLTVKINDVSRAYGNPNPLFTVSFSGFKNEEDESVIDIAPSLSIAVSEPLSVGEYAIDVIPGTDNNYELIFEEGKLIITKATQVITFDELESPVLNTLLPFALSATSDSGLPVTYEIIEGPASYESESLTLSGGLGTVVITASQFGNENYHSATSVTRSFEVIQDPTLGVEDAASKFRLYPNPTLDGNLFVSGLSDEITDAVLIDSKGLSVRAKSQPSNGEVLIDTGESPSGLYILCLKTISGQKYFRKVIVQK